ncbi:hypothetical protein HZ326_18952 [Fusarium oxysporum f. sp. albedinis]|nr:Uncharacterized protein HZ326_21307 [Fusarium oxysporum f. sp. albedinis]KAJ0138089.1 hypothetical protein HZ326_18952 [Fusarium oxysporum f. sp. albedinis]
MAEAWRIMRNWPSGQCRVKVSQTRRESLVRSDEVWNTLARSLQFSCQGAHVDRPGIRTVPPRSSTIMANSQNLNPSLLEQPHTRTMHGLLLMI